MVRTSWAYTLRKDELVQYLEEFDLDASGTVEEMRKRFATFISGEHKEKVLTRLEELENKHGRCQTPTTPGMSTQLDVPTVSHMATRMGQQSASGHLLCPSPHNERSSQSATSPPQQSPHYSTVIDIVRKWSFRYEGGKDPIAFVERVEELAEVYGLDKNMLPRTMPELLKEAALLWFRNNNRQWNTWRSFKDDFLKFFLPPRYFEGLDDEIRRRQQKPRETFKDFVIVLQNMMRHAGYTHEQQVDRIFRNCLVDYQMYIRRKDFQSLEELIQMAEDFEVIRTHHPEVSHDHRDTRQAHRRDDRARQIVPTAEETPINPTTACRRCGQEGHGYRFCQNESVLFCWQCGRRGVRTRECCRRNAGNARGPSHQQGEAAALNRQTLPQ
ncbi:uncharacterized protein LOC119599916 [Lucilia sericata]|uniref:uncharacterized protein LOC119599916 n=1 Tax=Lucilia sericata TaxID=13632 RepID=UPI0018A7F952|nr:uncharacterized protein LOC119599916 [Lucilia sericata]